MTFLPLCFLSVTTMTAGFMSIRDNFWPLAVNANPDLHVQGYVLSISTAIMMVVLRDHPHRCGRALGEGAFGACVDDAGVGGGVGRYSERANSNFRRFHGEFSAWPAPPPHRIRLRTTTSSSA